jgi:hypothetical protein
MIFTALANAVQHDRTLVNFLSDNVSPATGIPLSFWIPPNYWVDVKSDPENETQTIERILATYGLNLYDGACWQIALGLADSERFFESRLNPYTRELLRGKIGDMYIRATNFTTFTFGVTQPHPYNGKYPFFYRMVSDNFWNKDPMTGSMQPWMDWKPVLGENAWLTLIGPLLSYNLYTEKTGKPLDYYQDEVQLAVKSLDVYLAMQSPLGGVYYAPKGTWKVPIPTEMACENNVSLYAGLQILRAILVKLGDPENRIPDIDKLLLGIETFLRDHAFDKQNRIFFQGGYIDSKGAFVPNPVFPLDVQTWGLSLFGQQVDSWYGEGTSYKMWEISKKRSGTFNSEGNVVGVGYTDGNDIISVEWTLGAINMCRILAKQYEGTNPEFTASLLKDARTMREGMNDLRYDIDSTHSAFKYADKRYFIPFGWYANPIPSTASTSWMLMVDANYNPFHISGEYIQPAAISPTKIASEKNLLNQVTEKLVQSDSI